MNVSKIVFSSKTKSSKSKAFTLVELIVSLVVLGIIVALAIPTYNTVTNNFMINTVNSSLDSIKRAGDLECSFKSNSSGSDVALAAIKDMPQGSMEISAVDNVVSASLTRSGRTAYGSVSFTDCSGTITSATLLSSAPSSYSTTIDTSSSNEAELTVLGSFTDSSTDTSFTRSSSQTVIDFSSANWEYITVAFTDSGIPLENSVYKSSGAPTAGVVAKLSNTVVTVDLSADKEFILTVKYNGRSTGTTYIVKPV